MAEIRIVHATTAGMNLATDLQHLAITPASESSIDEADGRTSGGKSQKGYPFACGDVAILLLMLSTSIKMKGTFFFPIHLIIEVHT